MSDNTEELDPHRLLDLTSLLRNHTEGDLATAILNDGIVGWDRYGRQVHFAKDSAEAKMALDGLAEQYAWFGPPLDSDLSPIDRYADFAPHLPSQWPEWGWYADALPDIGPAVEKPRRKGDITKEINTALSVLVALAEGHGIDLFSDPKTATAATKLLAFYTHTGSRIIPPQKPTLEKLVHRIRDIESLHPTEENQK